MAKSAAPVPTAMTVQRRVPLAPEGDIRRGGWILVLVGVVLVLVAAAWLLLF